MYVGNMHLLIDMSDVFIGGRLGDIQRLTDDSRRNTLAQQIDNFEFPSS